MTSSDVVTWMVADDDSRVKNQLLALTNAGSFPILIEAYLVA